MYLKCHYSTGGVEAVEGKQRFEQFANIHGVKIKAYRADNGIMAKKEYMKSIEINQQTITLSGVNNHSQNGIAERNIRTVSDRARTMLLHAIEKWPEAITLDLWPFALKMDVDIHNATPGKSGLSPEEIFTKQKARQDRLVDFHPFGCPVFVLDPKLQQGHKLPKWQPRARQAIYLGHSPRHAQTVPIVLNPRTGLCSPQYHVVFDDNFSTTTASTTNKIPDNWAELFTHSRVDCYSGTGFRGRSSVQYSGTGFRGRSYKYRDTRFRGRPAYVSDTELTARGRPVPAMCHHTKPIRTTRQRSLSKWPGASQNALLYNRYCSTTTTYWLERFTRAQHKIPCTLPSQCGKPSVVSRQRTFTGGMSVCSHGSRGRKHSRSGGWLI
jgi:hypothetical protein